MRRDMTEVDAGTRMLTMLVVLRFGLGIILVRQG